MRKCLLRNPGKGRCCKTLETREHGRNVNGPGAVSRMHLKPTRVARASRTIGGARRTSSFHLTLRSLRIQTRLSLVMKRLSLQTVNIHEAKTHLSRLIEEVNQGTSEVIIAKAGKPLVRLVRLESPKPVRKPGFLKGRIKIADDFDEPLPADLLDAFEGRK